MKSIQTTVVHGQPAVELLRDQQFLSQWQMLCKACPHTTAFQQPHFVRAWYDAYGAEWQPVIVQSVGAERDLVGLWLLAARKNELVHAGSYQAEYHVWLAQPGFDVPFLTAAWSQLKERFPSAQLLFKYLPSAALIEPLETALGSKHVIARKHERPLLKLDADTVKESFAKKSNKSRFNRLKKLGALEFRRITDPKEFHRVIDGLIDCYDFRQGAVNHVMPFREDSQKRKFHIDLFADTTSEDICVTATYLGDEVIAAFLGSVSGPTVHLGMMIHTPFLAEHSPGKIHIMQLSQHLIEQGKSVIDLTPGGDAWKERFADTHDSVAVVVAYASSWVRLSEDTKSASLAWGKRAAARISVTPAGVRSLAGKLRQALPDAALKNFRSWAQSTAECRIYRAERPLSDQFKSDPRVKRNSLADLMCFVGAEKQRSRDRFLSESLTRLERGDSVFTVRIGNRLACYAWCAEGQADLPLSSVGQSLHCPSGSMAIYDLDFHPEFREQSLNRVVLAHVLQLSFQNPTVQYAFIPAAAQDSTYRSAIESLGLPSVGSFHIERRAGVERKWATDPMLTKTASEAASA